MCRPIVSLTLSDVAQDVHGVQRQVLDLLDYYADPDSPKLPEDLVRRLHHAVTHLEAVEVGLRAMQDRAG